MIDPSTNPAFFSNGLQATLVRALKQSPASVVITDTQGNIEYVNPKFEEVTGYSYAEVRGRNPRLLKSGEMTPEVYAELWRVIAAGGEWRGQFHNRRKDGTFFWERAVISGITDDRGRVSHFLAVKEDITKQKRVEQALHESEEKHQMLLATSRDAIMTLAPPLWQFASANPASVEMFAAFNEAEICAVGPWQLSPELQPNGEASVAKARRIIDTALKRGSLSFNWTHRRMSGESFPAAVLLNRVVVGGRTMLQATLRDITGQQRARRALRESEAKVRAISASARDAIIMIGTAGEVTFWNPAAERIFGYTGREALGRDLHRLIAPERFHPAFKEAFSRFQARDEGAAMGREIELAARHKNGREFPVELSLSAVQLDGAWHALGLVRDITERKQGEEAVRDSQRRLQAILDHMPALVYAKDLEGRLTLVNRRVAALFGRPADQLVGLSSHDLLPAEIADNHRANDLQTMRHLRPVTTEEATDESDGRHTYLTVKFPLFDSHSQLTGICGISTDITERKRSEEDLRLSERFVRGTLDALAAHVCVLDEGGTIITVNRAWRDFAAANPPVAGNVGEGANYLAVCDAARNESSEQASAVAESIRAVLRGEGADFATEYACHSPGEQRWFIARVTRFAGEGPVRVVVAHENITKRKLAEEERAAMQSHVNQTQKLESIGRLAAGIAHEINTPTQYIGDNTRFLQDGFASLLTVLGLYARLHETADSGKWAPELSAQLDAAVQQADLDYLIAEIPKAIGQSLEGVDRVTRIVQAMKDFSHPGGEEKSAVNLNHAIESTTTVARNEWKYVADLRLELDAALPPVPVLAGSFNQVILNLVVNAAQAIAAKSDSGRSGKGIITVQTRRDENWAEVRVADTGCGIPPGIRDRIFTPFFTTKPVGKGTGQGLALARSVVVDKHGGTIGFESEEGAGTRFIIRLPILLASSDAQR